MSSTLTLIGFTVFATWFMIGLVVSVRHHVRKAQPERRFRAGVEGVLMVVPAEVYVLAVGVLVCGAVRLF